MWPAVDKMFESTAEILCVRAICFMEEILIFNVNQKMRLDLFLQQNLAQKIFSKSADLFLAPEKSSAPASLSETKNFSDAQKFSVSQKSSARAKSKNQISNSKIRRLIIAHKVFVDGRNIAIPSFELKKNSCVKLLFDSEKFFFEKSPDDLDFTLEKENVLFEDDVILVVNKPAFLPTEESFVGGRKNLHDCAVEYLWKQNPDLRNPPYVGIMHRLDRETSGTVLFTKSRSVNKAFHEMFENRCIEKIYFALCTLKDEKKNKNLAEKTGETFVVENYIGRISPKSQQCKMGILPKENGGLLSKTEFKIVKKFKFSDNFDDLKNADDFAGGKFKSRENCAKVCSSKNFKTQKNQRNSCVREYFLIECKLFSGRTHQIRVHLSSLGLPILGDELYGGEQNLLEKSGRIMLHAESLSFEHPLTKETLTVRAPLPF